jgi:nicotinamide-nucleotide amidase
VERAKAAGCMIATAESCTGGLIAAAITDIAGASAVFDRGFVTYSNAAKIDLLGVSATTLDAHGAVSPQTAMEMAAGALARSGVHLAVSVTGIAGPGGGSPEKTVGLVYIGVAAAGLVDVRELRLGDIGRPAIRATTVDAALSALLQALDGIVDQAAPVSSLPTP